MLPATRLIESLFFEPVSDPPMSRKLAKTGRGEAKETNLYTETCTVFTEKEGNKKNLLNVCCSGCEGGGNR